MSVRTATHVVSPPQRPQAPPPPPFEASTSGMGMTPQTTMAMMHNLTQRVLQLEDTVVQLRYRIGQLEKKET